MLAQPAFSSRFQQLQTLAARRRQHALPPNRSGNRHCLPRRRRRAAPGVPSDAGNAPLVFGQGLVEALFGGGVAGNVMRGVNVELHARAATCSRPFSLGAWGQGIFPRFTKPLVNVCSSWRPEWAGPFRLRDQFPGRPFFCSAVSQALTSRNRSSPTWMSGSISGRPPSSMALTARPIFFSSLRRAV